jgi:hypothetical protein
LSKVSCEEISMADDQEGPEQGALFRIDGPDEDGCVWMCDNSPSTEGKEPWCQNLGPVEPAAHVMVAWLESIDFGEKGKIGG